MARTLYFFFFFGSTYTYLSVMRIAKQASAAGVAVRWRPFSVRQIMTEMDNIPFAKKPVKAAYMWRDIERRAARLVVPVAWCRPKRTCLVRRIPRLSPRGDLEAVPDAAARAPDGSSDLRTASAMWSRSNLVSTSVVPAEHRPRPPGNAMVIPWMRQKHDAKASYEPCPIAPVVHAGILITRHSILRH